MRLIEFTEEVKLGARTFSEGSRERFEDDEAAEIIRLGWGKDSNTGEEGVRKPGAQKLEVQSLVHKIA